MEQTTLQVKDLYELRAKALGFQIMSKDKEGKQTTQVLCLGFINEPGLPEGVKRGIYKACKMIEDEITLIDKQRKDIQAYTEEGKTTEELEACRSMKDSELLDELTEITIEKIDFKRVENLTLSENYQFLYDKLFK